MTDYPEAVREYVEHPTWHTLPNGDEYVAKWQADAAIAALEGRVYMPCHVCGAEPFTKHRSICSMAGWQEARVVAEQMKAEVARLDKELSRYRRNCTCEL